MSSPFSFRPSAVVVGIEILPKDSYTFEVGEPKSFIRTSKDPAKNNAENFGVMYPLKVVSEGASKGKTIYQNLWMHSEGGQKAAKGFLMAATGFSQKQEKEYDTKYETADFSYDPNAKTAGAAWHELTGKMIKCDLDVGMDTEQKEVQKFGFWQAY